MFSLCFFDTLSGGSHSAKDFQSNILTLRFSLLLDLFALGCGIRQLPLSFWRWAVGGRLAFGVGARLRRTLALDCGVGLPLSF